MRTFKIQSTYDLVIMAAVAMNTPKLEAIVPEEVRLAFDAWAESAERFREASVEFEKRPVHSAHVTAIDIHRQDKVTEACVALTAHYKDFYVALQAIGHDYPVEFAGPGAARALWTAAEIQETARRFADPHYHLDDLNQMIALDDGMVAHGV